MAVLTGEPVQQSGAQPVGPIDWSSRLAGRTREQDNLLGGILALANVHGLINFSGGFPEPSLFPTAVVRDIATRLLDEDAGVALQYAPSEGIASTRDAIAARLLVTDGRRPADDELMITSGGIDAVTLISKSMVDPGDVVLVEAPSYLGAIAGFAGFDAVVRGIPMDADGLDVDALAALLAGPGPTPKLIYTIPDFQNPSGRVLSTPRRHALIELCRRYGVLIIEDVAYSQLGFEEDVQPSLWSLAPDVTVQIGTFSKTFFPGVRLGWAAGPATIITQLSIAKQNSDQCSGALGQRLLEEYLRGGHFDAQLPKARALYRGRAEKMTAALELHFSDLGEWTVPRGGFFSWLRVPGVDTDELAGPARAANVAYVPGAGFFAEYRNSEHLRLSFSRVVEDDIDLGIARLASAVRAARS